MSKTWKKIATVALMDDYSTWKADTCNNGGDYSFHEKLDIFQNQINGDMRSVKVYNTSAEFMYDELRGSFEQDVELINVSNADCRGYYTMLWNDDSSIFLLDEISEPFDFAMLEGLQYKAINEAGVEKLSPAEFKYL
jgi:hypothetical protein